MKYNTLVRLALAAVFVVSAPLLRADEMGDQLKALVEKQAAVVVTVKLVVHTEVAMGGQSRDNEQRSEVHGVVVDADGLVMIPASAVSGDSMAGMMGGAPEGFEMKMTPTDIKVVVDREEKEYSAFLAATDSKLGLAFLKIEDLADRKLAAADFGAASDAVIGQQVAQIGRQAKGYDFAPYFETARVSGEIAKPRKAWMIDGGIGGFALPVFTLSGQVVGVLTSIQAGMNEEEEGGGGGMGFGRLMKMLSGGGGGGGSSTFILPGSVVKGLIAQAQTKATEVAAERAKQKDEENKKGADGDKGKDNDKEAH